MRIHRLFFLLVFIASCSHLERRAEEPFEDVEVMDPVGDAVPAAENDLTDTSIEGIPHEFNQQVEKWVNYFTGRGRHHMDRYLARMSRYSPKMLEILRENGLPEDLIYIALIESGFSPTAHSHANAVGYWQFIRGTGLRYGLHIDSLVDERRDFIYSTEAAAGYYKTLYGLFESWYLAIASYNTGENRVKRAVMKHRTRDFWVLAQRRALPRETRDYVPKYLAARMIGKDPKKYGFDYIEPQEPLTFEEITVAHPVDLKKFAEELAVDYQDIVRLNPSFKKGFAPIYRNSEVRLRVPVGMTEVAMAKVGSAAADAQALAQASRAGYIWYTIRRGDTLSTIARRHRTTMSRIREANNIRGNRIIAGRRLRIPESGYQYAQRQSSSTGQVINQPVSNPQGVHSGPTVQYRIRRGDNLGSIARRHGVSISEIVAANNLRSSSRIYAGQMLQIPARGGASTAVAGSSQADGGFLTYRVQRGDTLSGIAQRFGTTVNALKQANGLGSRSILYAGQEIRVPQGSGSSARSQVRHVVKRGENLTLIAQRHDVTTVEISRANNLRNPSHLRVGQSLLIPGRFELAQHRVRRGETLGRIAQRYKVSIGALARANDLENASHIRVGETLVIPR